MKTLMKHLILIMVFVQASLGLARSQSQKLLALDETVGGTFDTTAIKCFHLINLDLGISSVKVYENSEGKWILHLIADSNGRSGLFTKELGLEAKKALQTRITKATTKTASGSYPTFMNPALNIDLPGQLFSEEPVQLRLVDNTKIYGRFVKCTPEAVNFVTISEIEMTIPDDKIAEVSWPSGQVTDGQFRLHDPNQTRLFLGPTGRTLRKGEFVFADYYVLFPSFSAGVTDFFMIGGGFSLVPGADNQIFYIAPKFRLLHRESTDLSVGLLYFGIPSEEGLTIFNSALTIGSAMNSVSFGFGLPLEREDRDHFSYGVMIGGEMQASNSIKLISENWLFVEDDAFLLVSGGVRFMGERISVGLGLWTSPEVIGETGGFPFIPWLDFAYTFGR